MQVAQPALVRNQSAVISNSNKQGCIGGIACVQRRSQLQLLTAQSVTTTTRERTETGAGTEPPSTLFSNVNPRSLKRESGSVASAALLVGGATVGAGILALPAVTQVCISNCNAEEKSFQQISSSLCIWLMDRLRTLPCQRQLAQLPSVSLSFWHAGSWLWRKLHHDSPL